MIKGNAKGAVLYDFFQVPGGAERVTLELAREFNADIYVGYNSPDVSVTLGHPDCNVVSLGFNSRLLPLRTYHLIKGFSQQTQFLNNRSWVVYSGNFSPLAVHNHPGGHNILYCHNLPRFIYDMREEYQNRFSGWRQPLLNGLIRHLQPRYEAAFNAMDVVVANSENVRRRIRHYLGKDVAVVHPPCAVENKQWLGQDGYYLSLARLEPYKRVDRLIEAFLRMPEKRLIVTSGGSDSQRLQSLAKNAANIQFTGWLPENSLRTLIGNAIATLYIPQDEDFGMSPVESMAAGKPVIGVAEGGVLETVIPDQTGILISSDPAIEEIVAAVQKLTAVQALKMRSGCEYQAQQFSRAVFFQKMRRLIADCPT